MKVKKQSFEPKYFCRTSQRSAFIMASHDIFVKVWGVVGKMIFFILLVITISIVWSGPIASFLQGYQSLRSIFILDIVKNNRYSIFCLNDDLSYE